MQSGLFDAAETIVLSRLSGTISAYNNSVLDYLSTYRSISPIGSANDLNSTLGERVYDALDAVQRNRHGIVKLSSDLLKLWSRRELNRALEDANLNHEIPRGTDVSHTVENLCPQVLPPQDRARVATDLEDKKIKLEEAIERQDLDSACSLVTEIIREARQHSGKRLSAKKAAEWVAVSEQLRKELNCN
jgi:hypothetical protein